MTETEKVPRGVTVMLLPSAEYRDARPTIKDPHLTVCSFGRVTDYDNHDFVRAWGRKLVVGLASEFDPIYAVASGIGMFDSGPDGWAVVDLIDGIGTFNVRWAIESRASGSLDAPAINYYHGFTPHITRHYLERTEDIPFVAATSIDNVRFTFDAIGFWFGPEKYEISL